MPDALAFPPTLVTGDTGFVGQHVLAQIPGSVGLSSLYPEIDLRAPAGLADLADCVRQLAPARVIHLAAQSFVPESFRDPLATFEVNFLGTFHLLEALAAGGFAGRLLFVGTGDVYGPVSAADLPLIEARPLTPTSPYAVSKIAAEALCRQWSRSAGFAIVMARPFNHIGAGQSEAFAIADFARQIAEIGAGSRPPQLTVGNIEVSRDFTDVADVVRAYQLLLEKGANGEVYNVCSGVERSIRQVIEQLLAVAGIGAEIVTDPGRFRPSEQPRVCGSHQKITAATGWQPQIAFTDTLRRLYRYWEEKIGQ